MPDFISEHPISEALAQLAEAIDRFCDSDPPESPEGIGDELIHLRHQVDRLEVAFSTLAAAFAATKEHERQGSISPVHWIRHHCNMGAGAAADRIAVGAHSAVLPESHVAVEEGRIGFAHLALIARTADALTDALAPSEPSRLDEMPLLDKAIEFSVGRFRYFCEHARHAADADRYARGEIESVEARRLTLRQIENGLVSFHGTLDSEGGALLRNALEPLARRNGRHDARLRRRRLADALVELASHATRPAQLQVTTTLETLLQRAGAPAADLEFSLPISARAVERIACDCSVTRILLGADSTVIDVGRSKRVISPSTRRALNVRDRGCRWPGCDRSATWTAGHHVVHWSRGGRSDLSNLVLLCHRHHWMVHEGGWQVVLVDGGVVRTVPPSPGFYDHHLARGPDRSAA